MDDLRFSSESDPVQDTEPGLSRDQVDADPSSLQPDQVDHNRLDSSLYNDLDLDNLDAVTPPFLLPEDDLFSAPERDEFPVAQTEQVDNPPTQVTEQVEEVPPTAPIRTRQAAYQDQPLDQPTGTRRRPVAHQPVPIPQSRRGYACADIVTAIFLLMTIGVCASVALLIANPHSGLNPFPPPTPLTIIVLATDPPTLTPSTTPTPLPPTQTPLATATPTATATFTATATPTTTDTPVFGQPAATVTETAAPNEAPTSRYTLSPFPFTVDSIRYAANTSADGCSWQSIAGSVLDLVGTPIKGMAIRVTGSNGNIDEVHYTGTEPRFGEGGFEVFLGAIPREDQYTVQLLARTGTPISDAITVQTHTGCKENVVVVKLVQNHPY